MSNVVTPLLRIPMPWTGVYYSINWDKFMRGRKEFFVAFRKVGPVVQITIGICPRFKAPA